MTVVITGVGMALAGVSSAADLLAPPAPDAAPVEPRDRIGKSGLRYKDRATQLAYCAARDALRDAALLDDDGPREDGETTGVVASSNYGNVDTICRVTDTIARESAAKGSPMDLPNASSNVIASSVAIRFGLRGPNLMLCNGATSGLDAVHWAATLIRSGRAARTLVLGVEPDNPAVRALNGGARLLDGAVALVLESATVAERRGARALAGVGRYARGAGLDRCVARLADTVAGPALWHLPEGAAGAIAADVLPGVPRRHLAEGFGRASGALGVLQCAAVAGWFGEGGAGPVYATAGAPADDASAALALLSPGAP